MTATRRFMPPLKVDTGRFRHSSGSRRASSHLMRDPLTDRPAHMDTFSMGEKDSQSLSS